MNLKTRVPVFKSITVAEDSSTLLVLLSKFYYEQSSPVIQELVKFVICNLYFLCVLISSVASVGLLLVNMIWSAYYTILFWTMRDILNLLVTYF